MARYRAKLTSNGMYIYKPQRTSYVQNYTATKLLKDVKRLVKQTNKKLNKLVVDVNKGKYNPKTKRFERQSSVTFIDETGKKRKRKISNVVDYRHTFASKKLEELESYKYNENQIKLTGNESKEELLSIKKYTENFLKSKTSTVKGIKEVEKGIKSNISQKLDEYELSPDEADSLYKLFEDKDFTALRKYLDPSEIQALMLEVRDYKDSIGGEMNTDEIEGAGLNMFLKLFTQYAGLDVGSVGTDADLQNSLKSLYDKIDDIL